jgi:hypothetical protein
MQVRIRMLSQEPLHLVGLVGREIIEDHVNVLLGWLMGHEVGKKSDELGRGMPVSGAPEHVPGARIERGVERQRSVAGVVPSCGPRRVCSRMRASSVGVRIVAGCPRDAGYKAPSAVQRQSERSSAQCSCHHSSVGYESEPSSSPRPATRHSGRAGLHPRDLCDC